MIEFKNISYQKKHIDIINDVSFTVNSNSCCALIGHNGAGKTTLIKLLLGYIKPQSGYIVLKDIRSKYKPNIGFVPESLQFHGQQSGIELLYFTARIKNVKASNHNELINIINHALESVDLLTAKDKKINAYSKGMKQRLGLAQALLGNPSILVMDEPASGLDPDSRLILYQNLKEHASNGNTVLFSSHALNDIEHYIDHIVLLEKGRVLDNNPISEFRLLAKYELNIQVKIDSLISNDDALTLYNKLLPFIETNTSKEPINNILPNNPEQLKHSYKEYKISKVFKDKLSSNIIWTIYTKDINKKSILSILIESQYVIDIDMYYPTLEQTYYHRIKHHRNIDNDNKY